MVYDKENRLSVHAHFDAGKNQVETVTYTYEGGGLKRGEIVDAAMTTIDWDGDEYLGEEQ